MEVLKQSRRFWTDVALVCALLVVGGLVAFDEVFGFCTEEVAYSLVAMMIGLGGFASYRAYQAANRLMCYQLAVAEEDQRLRLQVVKKLVG